MLVTARTILAYYAVAAIVLSSEYMFQFNAWLAAYLPTLLSILLLIPIYLWQADYRKKAKLSKEISEKDKRTMIFRIMALFILAFSIRIPSVLLFSSPYEKTPLIYLLVLTMLLIEKTDLSPFGFKTENLGRSLTYGVAFFAVFGGFAHIAYYALVYGFTGQMAFQSYNVGPFLSAMPFMALCVGVSEEGLFRGYMQTHLEKRYSVKQAVLAQAALFGVWHFVWNLAPFDPWGMIQYVATTFFIGLVFGYFYSKTKNLIPLILAHGLWNSVPQGIIENGTVVAYFSTFPWRDQMLALILPFTVSVATTVLFIKYLVKKV